MESSMMWQTDTCANWQDPSGEKELRATQSVSTSVMRTYQQRDRRRVRRTTPSNTEPRGRWAVVSAPFAREYGRHYVTGCNTCVYRADSVAAAACSLQF